ncbi:hexose transporter [Ophiostoma piceae UAMH 11346]|uniref:Hexose transporter n=1 Tax=Ophiostoma piceae (strain UAMH 11346) TaxID=1262450 RepID=S3BWC5_OPHP1|nr:hexose transporter [Ophiostoma piceae UAMH 11346]
MSTEVQTVSQVLVAYPPKKWYHDWQALRLYLVLFPGVLFVSGTVGYDGSMLNGLQSLDTFKEFFHPTTAVTGLLNSSYGLGSILSFPFAPLIASRYGRRQVVIVNSFIMFVGAALQGSAKNVGMFCVARILFGFAATTSTNSAPAYVAELAHPRDRRFITALYNGTYYIGAIMAAWITYGTFPLTTTYGWRIPSYLQGAVALINLVFVLFVPESPRYLIARGRHEEAHRLLARIHGDGDDDLNNPLVKAELAEITHHIEAELNAYGGSVWNEFFTQPVHRKRLFLLAFIGQGMNWSGNGIVSYYLSKVLTVVGVTEQGDQTKINGILQVVSFVTCLVASWVATWSRRRTQFMVSIATMFFSFLAVTIANSVVAKDENNRHASVSVIVFVFLFMCGYNWAFNPLAYAYPVEFLPYNIRTIGVSWLSLWCMGVGFANTWVNPVGLDSIGWKYYIVYVVWLPVEFAVVYLTFPETKGYALEEVSAILDNDRFFNFRHGKIVEKRVQVTAVSQHESSDLENSKTASISVTEKVV